MQKSQEKVCRKVRRSLQKSRRKFAKRSGKVSKSQEKKFLRAGRHPVVGNFTTNIFGRYNVSLALIDCEIFAKTSPKTWKNRKSRLSRIWINGFLGRKVFCEILCGTLWANFTFLIQWISRLKGRCRLTHEWPTLYEISRGTSSTTTNFRLGLIDREIFTKMLSKTWKKAKIWICTHLNGFLG